MTEALRANDPAPMHRVARAAADGLFTTASATLRIWVRALDRGELDRFKRPLVDKIKTVEYDDKKEEVTFMPAGPQSEKYVYAKEFVLSRTLTEEEVNDFSADSIVRGDPMIASFSALQRKHKRMIKQVKLHCVKNGFKNIRIRYRMRPASEEVRQARTWRAFEICSVTVY